LRRPSFWRPSDGKPIFLRLPPLSLLRLSGGVHPTSLGFSISFWAFSLPFLSCLPNQDAWCLTTVLPTSLQSLEVPPIFFFFSGPFFGGSFDYLFLEYGVDSRGYNKAPLVPSPLFKSEILTRVIEVICKIRLLPFFTLFFPLVRCSLLGFRSFSASPLPEWH